MNLGITTSKIVCFLIIKKEMLILTEKIQLIKSKDLCLVYFYLLFYQFAFICF